MIQLGILSEIISDYIDTLTPTVEKFSQLNIESQLFNDEAISTDQLEKVYGPLTARVEDTVKTQDQMLTKITVSV